MNFLPLPAYQAPNALNFAPLTQAIDSGRRNALAQAQLDLQNRQFGISEQQFGLQKRDSDLSYAERQRRRQQWDAFETGGRPTWAAHLQPGVYEAGLLAGPDKAPEVYVNSLIKKKQSDEERGLRLAQAANQYAQADLSNARALTLPHPAGSAAGDPFEDYGLDADGSMIRIGGGRGNALTRRPTDAPAEHGVPAVGRTAPEVSQSLVLGTGESRGGTSRSQHGDYGAYGQTASEVPGIIVTPKGAPSQFGTQAARGQAATDSLPEEARQRSVEAKKVQDYWTWHRGKPPAGKMYTPKGALVSMEQKESVQDSGSIASANMGLSMLDQAEKILTGGRRKKPDGTIDPSAPPVGGTTYLSQYSALPGYLYSGTPGGLGESGQGFRAARVASMNLAFSLSGKSVSNKEHELFADVFTPSPTDSLMTQQWKIDTMRDYFRLSMAARKRGASDSELSEMFYKTLEQGLSGAGSSERAPPTSRPAPQSPAAPAPLPRNSMPPMQPGAGGWVDTPQGRYRRME